MISEVKSVVIARTNSGHYRFAGVVARSFFFWTWSVVQLPGMKRVASGISASETKAEIMAAAKAYSFAAQDEPIP